MVITVSPTANNCPYPKPDEYNPRPLYFFMYYPPMYAQVFQMASFLCVFPTKIPHGKIWKKGVTWRSEVQTRYVY